jgi:hypothetical protein
MTVSVFHPKPLFQGRPHSRVGMVAATVDESGAVTATADA